MIDCLILCWKGLAVLYACILLVHFRQHVFLSVAETKAVLCPKASFTKKKTSSKWRVFGDQQCLWSRWVLPGAIVSHIIRILSYLMLYSTVLWSEWTYLSMWNTIWILIENFSCLTIIMINMGDYWPVILNIYIS